jgi:hypothetical protein
MLWTRGATRAGAMLAVGHQKAMATPALLLTRPSAAMHHSVNTTTLTPNAATWTQLPRVLYVGANLQQPNSRLQNLSRPLPGVCFAGRQPPWQRHADSRVLLLQYNGTKQWAWSTKARPEPTALTSLPA